MAKKATGSSLGTSLEDHRVHLKTLYYGRQGTGKTTAAALASRSKSPGKIMVIDSEGGLIPRALKARGVDISRVVVWPPNGERVTSQSLEDLHESLSVELADDPESWHTIVFDSMTEIHHILRENATHSRVENSRVVVDPDYVDRDDYNKMTTQMRRIIRLFRDLPCHVVFTALERVEDSGEIRPAISPALGNDLMGYVDEVIRTAVVRGQVIGRFVPTENIHAKDRIGVFPTIMADPSFDRILAVYDGDLDLNEDEAQLEFLAAESAAEEARNSKKKD